MSRAPVVVVTGIAEVPMAAATIGLQCDLPQAVVMHHRIDVSEQRLHRVVSDLTGTLDHTVIELEHACVHCAVREDVVPTLHQLTEDGRWDTVIAHLPVGAEATQVCRVSSTEGRVGVTIANVVAALDSETLIKDLLGDDLLCERGLHSGDDDERGVAEAGAAIIEYADHVALSGTGTSQGTALVSALARPGVAVADMSGLESGTLLTRRRRHDVAESWVKEVRRGPIRPAAHDDVWTLDLQSTLPLHPGRLLDAIESMGGGPRRSRGCFWLPSRPGEICGWQGAGGQLSIGSVGSWGASQPLTRITVTGLDKDAHVIRETFQRCLVTEHELGDPRMRRMTAHDGFEPWLGPIARVA
ncbi:MAG: GTP-binding protein [Ornithinimicrobium sp.]